MDMLDNTKDHKMDTMSDRMEVEKTCYGNSKEFRRMKVAFQFDEFVVDNDDDEIDLVRNHSLRIHEFANLNFT